MGALRKEKLWREDALLKGIKMELGSRTTESRRNPSRTEPPALPLQLPKRGGPVDLRVSAWCVLL